MARLGRGNPVPPFIAPPLPGGDQSRADADASTSADNQSIAASLPSSDISTSAEAQSLAVSLSSSDTGSFADTGTTIRVSSSDTSTSAEGTPSITASLSSSDTGSSVDNQATPTVLVSSSDTGHGTDNQTVPSATLSSSDSFAAVLESGSIPTPSDSDSASSTEAQSVSAHVSSSDTGSSADTGTAIRLSSSDTGSLADAQSPPAVLVSSSDTSTLAEQAPSIRVSSSDASTSTDTGFSDHPFSSDSGHFQDLEIPPPQGVAPPIFESFSLSHAAILDGFTGAEAMPLYAVRAGSIVPQLQSSFLSCDDVVIGSWNWMDGCALQIDQGFLSFRALSLITSVPVLSSGTAPSDYYAMAFADSEKYPNHATVPVLLRTFSRDDRGNNRTLDIVLYKVAVTFHSPGAAYKNGLVISFAGTARRSLTDETGTALAKPAFGRLVSSPGVLTGAVASSYRGGS